MVLIHPLDSHMWRSPPHLTPYLFISVRYVLLVTCFLMSRPANLRGRHCGIRACDDGKSTMNFIAPPPRVSLLPPADKIRR